MDAFNRAQGSRFPQAPRNPLFSWILSLPLLTGDRPDFPRGGDTVAT